MKKEQRLAALDKSVLLDIFVKNIEDLMNEKNVSVREVEEVIGLPFGSVRSYIEKERLPTIITIELIARYFELDPVYLIFIPE